MGKYTASMSCLVCLFALLTGLDVRAQTSSIQSPSDTLKREDGALSIMVDSLFTSYIEQDDEGSDPIRSGRLSGRFSLSRTLKPLSHHGSNIFQDALDDPRILDAARRLKNNTEWHPFRPGTSGNRTYDYHYTENGMEKPSYVAELRLERPLSGARRFGFRYESRMSASRGPFPNQHTTILDGLGRFSFRYGSNHRVDVGLLGIDNGWILNRGNSVFTDRSRFMLEQLNTWRARTAGMEIVLSGPIRSGLEYSAHGRLVSQAWVSDPPDPTRLIQPSPSDTLPLALDPPPGSLIESRSYLQGVFPVVNTTVFAARRNTLIAEVGGTLTRTGAIHRITFGTELRFHRLRNVQTWQTTTLLDRFDLTTHPGDQAVFFTDQFRFYALSMSVGLRYERHDPGAALWSDLYRSVVDERVGLESTRRDLLAHNGRIKATHLLNPHISVSYPARSMTASMTFSVSSRNPTLEDYFHNHRDTPYTDRFTPSLTPLRVLNMEGGVGVVRRAYTMNFTVFYRDAERYIPRYGPDPLPLAVSSFSGFWGRVEKGFQRQRGLEMSIIRRQGRIGSSGLRLSGRMSYLLLFDTGKTDGVERTLTPQDPILPSDLTAFDPVMDPFWNRRHWISISTGLLFSSGVSITGLAHLQSGVPYSEIEASGSGSAVETVRHGSWTRRLDGRLDIPVYRRRSGIRAILFLEGRNLINDEIINKVTDPGTYERNGQPDNPIVPQTQRVFGPARSFWTGVEFRW